jgi:hypothetical protein
VNLGGITTPNVLDAVVLGLLVYVLFRGWRHGGVSQLAAFGGLLLGLLVGMWRRLGSVDWPSTFRGGVARF